VDTAVAKAQAAAKQPAVLVVTGSGRDVYGGSNATYVGSLLAKLGANNVLGSLPGGAPIAGFGTVDLGQLASRNPDAVLAIPSGAGTLVNDITSSPAWASTAAVRNGRVYQLDATLFLRSPGPRVAEALEKLVVLLYP
jgi:ABC-type Fe3+-hydroxamate transport system substrate-binding protein